MEPAIFTKILKNNNTVKETNYIWSLYFSMRLHLHARVYMVVSINLLDMNLFLGYFGMMISK